MNDESKLPAPVQDDDGFNPITPTDRVVVGSLLKFVDGAWSESGIKVPAGTRLLALSTHVVLQRWKDQRVVETITTKPLPNVDDLNAEIPRTEWELDANGVPRPPWQTTFVTYLLNPTTCEKFTVASSTVGCRIATETLADRVAWMRRLRDDNVVPEVELTAKPMKTRFGVKQRPEFRIVGWVLLGGGDAVALPGGGRGGNGGGQLALPGLTPVTPPSLKEELNDEIGF